MKKSIAVLGAATMLLLAACDDKTAGEVTAVYTSESAHAVYNCNDGQWAIVVLVADNKEHANCVSAETAAKYTVGQKYP